jgi:signal transduction histidine kinase
VPGIGQYVSTKLTYRLVAIVMLCVLVASGPATIGFYLFSRETAIDDASQLIASITSNKVFALDAELKLAGQSLTKFRNHLSRALQAPPTDQDAADFYQRLTPQANGMIALDRSRFDGHNEAGIFLNPTIPVDAFSRALHVRAQRLMTIYGSAVVPPFDSLWLLTRRRSGVVYMPKTPNLIYRAQLSDDYSATEWLTLGDPASNPDRNLRWTKANYDFVSWSWVVSAVMPIDFNGQWIGTIGHDIAIGNLLDQLTRNDTFKSTEHFLIARNDEPILAGHWQESLEAGTMTVEDKAALKNVIAALRQYAPTESGGATIHRFGISGMSSIVVSDTIGETGWTYYRVVSIPSIVGRITSAFIWTTAIAIAAMLLIAIAVHTALRLRIVQPVRELSGIVAQFSEGHTDARAPVRSDDEIGHLATAFNSMADRIQQTHNHLTQAQQDLRRHNQDLIRASRIKTNFLANMSHELRTPLNAILGFADVMQTQLFGPLGNARYLEYTEDIKHSGQHLLALINDVLDMSRIEAGKADLDMIIRDLAVVIQSSVAMVRATAQSKAIRFQLNLPDQPLMARCDQRAVTQMLLNLLSNAIKFSPVGSTITVTAQRTPTGSAEIAVADQGPGIAEVMLPRLFEPFSPKMAHIASNQEGTGLGLSITKGLIEAHDGQIDVETGIIDQPGAAGTAGGKIGTRMRLTFPPCASI